MDRTISGAKTPCQSGPGSDGNGGVLRIPQSPSITGASPSDCLVSYPGLHPQPTKQDFVEKILKVQRRLYLSYLISWEMQRALSRIWTWVGDSISYDDKTYFIYIYIYIYIYICFSVL